MRVSLILGGARSGKSARALELATAAARTFVATAEALDDEMAGRIARHQAERDQGWTLVEAPLDLAPVIAAHSEGAMVVDCLTLWLSNLMHDGRDPAEETGILLDALAGIAPDEEHFVWRAQDRGEDDEWLGEPPRIILVSNEVGLSIAPDNALARRFRDEQGRLNQRIAAIADHVEFIAAGLPLVLKGTP